MLFAFTWSGGGLAVLATLAGTVPAVGDVTTVDRAVLVAHLEKTSADVLESIDGLTEAQWKWKPAPDRWSVAEVAEHITTAEHLIVGKLIHKVMATPASAAVLERTKGKEAAILAGVPDRTRRLQAPDALQPERRWPTPEAAAAEFRKARATTLALAQNARMDLRAYAAPGPVVGDMDAYQWLLFTSAHTERHIKQIREVKATAGFPAP
jgi:hypothetical protein